MSKAGAQMPHYVVGIDVETTSLDPSTGDIIDVAAIRYDVRTGHEVDRIEHLTKPTRPLSEEITALTGIRQEMVQDAQPFSAVKDAVAEFIGDDFIFAHNAPFDLGYLKHHGLELSNLVWDTFPLASVAWPTMASYNLGFLAQELQITVTAEHRAAADVELTWQLLRHIQQTIAVSPDLFAEVIAILKKAQLIQYEPLFSQGRTKKSVKLKTSNVSVVNNDTVPKITHAEPTLRLESLFAAGGVFQGLTGYEIRQEQEEMAKTVATWITEGRVGLVEAGTGVGKTFAYLAAALTHLPTHHPLVISTYTKQLQDQLIEEDLPKLLSLVGSEARTAVLKGRRNYVCAARVAQALKRPTFSPAEAFLLIKILMWLEDGGSGDMEQINLSHQAASLLRLLHADTPLCRATCARQNPLLCSYQRARHATKQADIIVVNHALLTRMSSGEESMLPNGVIIIDEAHHLEEAARQASRIDLSGDRLREIVGSLRGMAERYAESSVAERATSMAERVLTSHEEWLIQAGSWVQRHSEKDRILLTLATRKGSQWQHLYAQAEAWRSQLKFLMGLARSLTERIPVGSRSTSEEALREAERFSLELQHYFEGNSERIQWIAREENPFTSEVKIHLNDVALSVAALLQPLFSSTKAVILTSATLSIDGKFDYLKKMLGLEEAIGVSLGTPYNLRDQMLLYLIDDGPLPTSSQFEPFISKVISTTATTLQGRTLVLFTAKAMIKKVYELLIPMLNRAKIRLFAQNVTGGRRNMLQRFRNIEKSVLLGTATFWEGVDVPGESLSCVIIPKLPFSAPDDPIITALAESLGVNGFREIAVPRMLITLRQGIGRLVRSTSDRGVVILLDPRLHRAEYGQIVIKNLPPATIHIGGVDDLNKKVEEWFGKTTLDRWHQHPDD